MSDVSVCNSPLIMWKEMQPRATILPTVNVCIPLNNSQVQFLLISESGFQSTSTNSHFGLFFPKVFFSYFNPSFLFSVS